MNSISDSPHVKDEHQNLGNQNVESPVDQEKQNKMNNSQSTPSLNQIFLKREQLKTIRDQLYTIQKQEDKTLQDYSSLEIDLQQKFNALRDCFLKVQIPNLKKSQKYNQINKEVNEIFENIMRQYDENKKLREKIVSNDHHNFIKINEEQNRASDARFKFDRDRLVYEKLKREHEVLEIENQELKELAESIRDEYISLNTQQKLFEDEFTRITLKLEGQKKKFDNLTEKYIELKQKNDILNQEREKREIVYKKRIEDALKKKDELQKYIDDIQKQQKQIDLKIESNTQIIEDLNYNRDRLNSEINKLVQISNRRKEQQDQYDLIITT